MSLDIKYIKDTEGNNYFPVVHEKGVVDDNGTTLESKLQSKQDAISDIDTIRSKANTAIQSITVGTTTTGEAGSSANVINTGTATTPILSFTIPQGAQGIQGPTGPQGERGLPGESGVTGDVSGFTVHQTINSSTTYGATDIAGAASLQATNQELTELGGEVALGAVYDVSAENPTAGPNSDGKWETLSTLLSDANLNTLIPTALRKGGMSIKFIQSSDNKYVQYRYMGTEVTGTPNPFLNRANWQKVDDFDNIFNINYYHNSYTPYENSDLSGNLARQSVPVSYRKCGLIVTFLTTAGWRKEQFVGNSDLDLSDNSIWRNADNWKPLEGKEFININALVGDLDTPFDSLYNALRAAIPTEYKKQKGTIITFLHGCSQIDEIIVNSPKAILDGTLTITVEGTDYTVPYANEETRDSIYTKIAALTIPNHTITYTSGDSYVFITADEIGSKPSASVSTTGGLTVSYIEYRKGTNKNWRTYQYINDTNLNYWSNINYWQALYVNSDEGDDSNIISAIASESFQYSNMTYSNGNLLSASIKWPDGELGQMNIVYNGDKISYINYTRNSETYRQTLTYTNGELSKTEINKL